MRYGNFVGQGWMKFSSEEIEMIKLHLKDQLEEAFGKGFFNPPIVKYEENDEEESSHNVILLYIQFPLETPFSGRNCYRDTVKNATSVNFFVTKDKKGYLQMERDFSKPVSEWERDYENCPEFCYGCNMSVTGSERRYRCKHWESIQPCSPYTYGTEVTDLTYTREDLRKLKNKITL